MKARAALLILWLLVAAWLAATSALATAASAETAAAGRALNASSAVSMDQAVKLVERRFHARVVKAETERDNGRTLYVLRLLSDSGRVWTVRVDAADGAVQ